MRVISCEFLEGTDYILSFSVFTTAYNNIKCYMNIEHSINMHWWTHQNFLTEIFLPKLQTANIFLLLE